ncbi:MAG: nucleoside triphosphate pyrophosphohydrolase [Thiofilum sp.]|uniref:nucleoside triphosphate pyrophosphohydrolase n=1 Tax=Thiofilum sp. TaxID=2212733 RepID=UPI0025E0B3A8|nr:nucleoside triphosphate pyrophosphohydrolase [Thiofilum sp.]MBK8453079.1 nucleoside triphosphate pyrophosphohydrolase [Thiofilum sp.]
MAQSAAINELLNLMQHLRDPETGCPWDKRQTWQTILPYTIEEVYEVADAIDRNDAQALQDELGDLLFQVVFMAQIAAEKGLFNFNDIAQGITEKMQRRHPHIFADTTFANETAQKQAWESIKAQERNTKESSSASLFANIPTTLPTLQRSQKLQKRAARVGFDWEHWRQVLPKIQEELAEVIEAVEQGEPFARVEEEVGDVIFGTTNLARLLGVNADNALRLTNRKFEQRFLKVEALLNERGISLEQATLQQMDEAWEQAKQFE